MTHSDVQNINDVQLTNVFLYRVGLQNRQEFEPLPQGAEVRWKVETKIAHRVPSPNELRIKVRAELGYEEGSPRPFDLFVEVVGVYRSESPIEPHQVPALIRTHSQPLLWPYVREVISDLTRRAGGPTLIVPTLKINIVTESKPKTERRKGKRGTTIPATPPSGDDADNP